MWLKMAFDIPGRSDFLVVIDNQGMIYFQAESVGTFLNRRSIYDFKNRHCKRVIPIPPFILHRSASSKTTLAVFTFEEMIAKLKDRHHPLREINEIESFWMHGYVDNIEMTVPTLKKLAPRLVVYRCSENLSNPIPLQDWISRYATLCKETFAQWDRRKLKMIPHPTGLRYLEDPHIVHVPNQSIPMEIEQTPDTQSGFNSLQPTQPIAHSQNGFAGDPLEPTQPISDSQNSVNQMEPMQPCSQSQNGFVEHPLQPTQQISDSQNIESRNRCGDFIPGLNPLPDMQSFDFQIVYGEMLVPRNVVMNINGVSYSYKREGTQI